MEGERGDGSGAGEREGETSLYKQIDTPNVAIKRRVGRIVTTRVRVGLRPGKRRRTCLSPAQANKDNKADS